MTASFSNHELKPVYPTGISARTTTEEVIRGAGRGPSRPSFGQHVGRLVATLGAIGRRQRVINELAALSDYELADIGLSRSTIHRVFDADFAAELNARR